MNCIDQYVSKTTNVLKSVFVITIHYIRRFKSEFSKTSVRVFKVKKNVNANI